VYRLIGQVYRRVRDLEPWLAGARPTAEAAIVGAAERKPHGARSLLAHTPEVEGAAQMLLELGVQFDIVDPETEDFARYRAVIVPDGHVPSAAAAARLDAARRAGTHLILSGTAALDRQSGRFVLADVPVSAPVPAPTVPSYVRPTALSPRRPELATDYWYAFYDQAYQVTPAQNTQTSGELSRARYTRSWEHFTSHAQAPVGDRLPAPLVVTGDNITYLAAPLFGAYARHDYWVYRALVEQVLERALPSRLLRLHGPAWIEAVLHEQVTDGRLRHVVHLTAYHPRRTSQPVPHVDESALTAGVRVWLPSDGRDVARVYLAPGNQKVDWDRDGGTITAALPPIGTHTVLVVEYETAGVSIEVCGAVDGNE
jgi:Beta-galactosidase trimerisation domain